MKDIKLTLLFFYICFSIMKKTQKEFYNSNKLQILSKIRVAASLFGSCGGWDYT